MNLNVDKSQWTKVRLGDVATEYSSRINDPSSGDRERFVGSSCIGQWDFRVQEWESTESVTSAMKLFEEGDYLLVRRSLYASDFRERAPRAHFAGVCSGDILTIRENPEFVADGFLIGILNNPSIWSYIVANASGSITRRIKWKDLANYEFLLPPKDQQAEIAELLWALDSLRSSYSLVRQNLVKRLEAERITLLGGGVNANRVEQMKSGFNSYSFYQLAQVVPDIEYGISLSIPKNQDDDGYPIISTADINRSGKLLYSKVRSINYDKMKERLTLQSGDVLFNWRNSVELIGKSAIFVQPENDSRQYTFASFILRLRCDERRVHNGFLMRLLNYYREVGVFVGLARKAVNQANFNKNEVGALEVPVPDLVRQIEVSDFLARIEDEVDIVTNILRTSGDLMKSLCQRIFS